MPRIKIGDEEIFYTHSPSDQPRNLVLIHGSGGDHAHWPEALRRFPGASVYGLDLPGHGRSSGQGRTSVAAYADFIATFVQKLELDQVTLFGHSLGGAIAQQCALQDSAWLAAIVLVGTGARLRVAPSILEGLRTGGETVIEEICQWSFGPTATESLIAPFRERFLKTPAPTFHGDYSACDQFDIMQEVAQITCPTLVVSGTADKLTPVKYGEYLYQRIAGAEMATIPDAGHMMALEKSAEFMQAVTAFFR